MNNYKIETDLQTQKTYGYQMENVGGKNKLGGWD